MLTACLDFIPAAPPTPGQVFLVIKKNDQELFRIEISFTLAGYLLATTDITICS
ncbi:hypothetical protein [Bacillus cereus]|uniref:hypothetical protein n=1 Tax=Bacillus cereus TaxID=1396 RepID=UPI0015914387|nr:hypothetical protein [Bacillus cereus]